MQKSEDISIGTLKRQYRDWATTKKEEIEEQRQARHYYHGDQWTEAHRAVMRNRGQPDVTYNRIARKINGVVGLIERLRQDPKFYARTPEHEEGAEIGTAVMRYALERVNWQPISSEAARQSAIDGIGGVELSIEEGADGQPEINLQIVDVDTFFYDPRSFRANFEDARYMGVAKWVDTDTAVEMFPDHEEDLRGIMETSSDLESEAQQDRESKWINVDEGRLRLVEHWYKKGGKWRYCFYVAGLKLDSGESPFLDENGDTLCRFLMFSANVDHEGDRYGFVRNLKSAQDEINQRRSKALHTANSRRIIAEEGAVQDVERTRREAARPDGFITINTGFGDKFKFEDVKSQADISAHLEMLKEAKDEVENFGFNPALVGQGVSDMSGRAIALQQEAGIAELGPYIIALKEWKIRIYRAVWGAIKAYWTGEKWIRVTDDDGLAQFIGVNQLVMTPVGPQIQNAIGSLDVDIILDEGPNVINSQQEAHDTLIALAGKGTQVPPEVLIELSSLPHSVKQKIMGHFEQARQAAMQQQQAEMQSPQAQAALQQEAAKTEKTQSETYKNVTETNIKVQEAAMRAAMPQQDVQAA